MTVEGAATAQLEARIDELRRRLASAEAIARAFTRTAGAISQALDPGRIATEVAESICDLLDARAAAVYRLHATSGELVLVGRAGSFDNFVWPDHLPRGHGVAGLALTGGRPATSPDVLADPQITYTPDTAEAIERACCRSVLSVPLVAEARTFGVLSLLTSTGRAFTAAEIDLAQAFANQAAVAVTSAQLYKEVADARDFLQSIMRNSVDAIVTTDLAGTVTFFSRAAEVMFGYRADQICGRAMLDFVEDVDELRRLARRLELHGKIDSYETSVPAADGRRIAISASFSYLRDARGQPTGVVAVARDVSAQKRAAYQLRLQGAALVSAANAIVITDRDGTIEWVNPAFVELTGYAAEEVVGRNPRFLKSGHHDGAFYEQLWSTILSGRTWRGEIVNRRKAGGSYLAEQTIAPVRNEQGDVGHFICISHDITERRRASEAQARLTAILEATPDFVGTATPDGQVLWINGAGRRMLGIPDDEDLTTTRIEDMHPEPVARTVIDDGIPAAIRDGAWSGEATLRSRDGREIAVSQVIVSHTRADGTVEFLSTIIRDVTERKHAAETLRQAEKLAAMGQLLAGVAHELNNPLAVVLAQTTLLARDTEGKAAERAAKITKAAERCARIVKNFLALARQYPPERTELDLRQLVSEALELVAYGLRVDNVATQVDIPADLPPLWADAHQFHQVIVNLITNAHHAMREVRRPRRLTIAARFDAVRGRVRLDVTDTGPGIRPAIISRIFEPFFTTKPVGEGTGLGLSLCQGIVETHGGTITVESTEGRGATFRIEMPVVELPPGVDAAPSDQTRRPTGRSILVVDDEPDVASVVMDMLMVDGHRVDTAVNGTMALEKLRAGRYDVVLTDLKMPGLDGAGLYAAVAALNGSASHSPFVFMTGDTFGATTRAFLDHTGAPCLNKPFSLADLRRVIDQVAGDVTAPVPDVSSAP